MTNNELISKAFDIGMLQQYEEIPVLVERVRQLNPVNIMEIGSCRGGTFYLWCKLAAPEGIKISLDLPNGRWGANDYIDDEALAERTELFKSWAPNVHVISGDSHDPAIKEQVRQILKRTPLDFRIPNGAGLDFLFIDGDHSSDGVRQDYEMYREFVRPGGLIAFHDIRNTEHHRMNSCFVHGFWEALDCQKEEIIDPLGYWGGIGVLTVPTKMEQLCPA